MKNRLFPYHPDVKAFWDMCPKSGFVSMKSFGIMLPSWRYPECSFYGIIKRDQSRI